MTCMTNAEESRLTRRAYCFFGSASLLPPPTARPSAVRRRRHSFLLSGELASSTPFSISCNSCRYRTTYVPSRTGKGGSMAEAHDDMQLVSRPTAASTAITVWHDGCHSSTSSPCRIDSTMPAPSTPPPKHTVLLPTSNAPSSSPLPFPPLGPVPRALQSTCPAHGYRAWSVLVLVGGGRRVGSSAGLYAFCAGREWHARGVSSRGGYDVAVG